MNSHSTKNTPLVLNKLRSVGSFLIGIVAFIVSIFADSSNGEDSAEITSGSLNYRTGKRDDGTDPCGRYDHE